MTRPRGWALWSALFTLIVLVAGCGSPSHPSYRTLPRPTLKNTPLKPPASDCSHALGGCLPQPKAPSTTTPTVPSATSQTGSPAVTRYVLTSSSAGITGPDFSNNTPIYSSSAWAAIARHSRFAYLKSVEGTGYFDSTAAAMARQAKAHGIPVGGYDFQHVCGTSPTGEAAFFVRSLYAQGLLGKGTLPPAADSEVGNGSCGGRVWLQTWVDTVYRLDGHVCPIDYTGAWWWQPNIGAWWPTCHNAQLKSWISGYNVRYPYMPAGIAHLDIWQFSDHGFNGYNNSDLSLWHGSAASFAAFVGHRAQVTRLTCFGPKARTKNATCRRVRSEVSKWDRASNQTRTALRNERRGSRAANCRKPYRRGFCIRSGRLDTKLSQRAKWFDSHAVATHKHYS